MSAPAPTNVVEWPPLSDHDAPDDVLPVESKRAAAPAPERERLPSAKRALDVAPGEPVTFSIAELLTAGDYGMIVGEDAAMKSTLALHLGGAKAGGYHALGRFETAPAAPVMFVSEEDDEAVLRNRLEAICRGHGWNAAVVLANTWILAKAEVRLDSTTWRAHLLAEIERIRPAIVFLDPLAELITGEENSNSEARPLIQAVRRFSGPSGASIIAVHHFGKAVEGKSLRDRIRGATSYTRASRCTYAVEHDDEQRELRITCIKLSRGEKPAPFVIRYLIDSHPLNKAVWTSARFDYVSASAATLDRAEAFVLEQLAPGERLNTTALKAAAKGSGVSGADIARGLKTLEMRKQIDFVAGEKGSKLWGLVCLPSDFGQAGNQRFQLAGQPECLPGKQGTDGFCLPSPFRGKQESADDSAGQPTGQPAEADA